MKKFLSFLLTLALLAALFAGCASNGESAPSTEAGTQAPTEAPAPEENGGIESYGYLIRDNTLHDAEYLLVIKNHSDVPCRINATATARDSNGNALASDSCVINALSPGDDTVGLFCFDDCQGLDTVTYALEQTPESAYTSVSSDIALSYTETPNGYIVTAKNNGDVRAQELTAWLLFFDASGEFKYYTSARLEDHFGELKPGKEQTSFAYAPRAYDHMELYLSGYSDGSTGDSSQTVPENCFDVEEYAYKQTNNRLLYFVAVTNNSDRTVCVHGTGIAKNADGDAICFAGIRGMLMALGPGEQSIDFFLFDCDSAAVDSVEYHLEYIADPPTKTSTLAGLSLQQINDDKSVTVTVTNNGSVSAETILATALFFNKQGAVVFKNDAWLTDYSELFPGTSRDYQINSDVPFDSVKVFLLAYNDK